MLRCLIASLMLCGSLNALAGPLLAQDVPPSSAAEPLPDKDGVYAMSRAITPPVLVYQVDPEFTEQARKKKVSGDVVVDFVVDATGKPTNVKTRHGLGYGLDEAAVKCVSEYKFKPALLRGKPVPVRMNVAVNFQMF